MTNLSDADIDLLERLSVCADRNPCRAPKADLLRLLALAGLDADVLVWRQVEEGADPAAILPDGLRAMIDSVLNPEAEG